MAVAVHSKLLLNLACVYRRPNSDLDHFTDAMHKLLSEMDGIQCDDPSIEHHTLILGDFNLDANDQCTAKFNRCVLPTFTQVVLHPTIDSGSIIDHAYTTLPADTIECFVGESYFSDHNPIFVAIRLP